MRIAIASGLSILAACGAPSRDHHAAAAATAGGALFARHCAVCHGHRGGGDGPVSGMLWPPPRDFGEGRFALVSTTNGVPTDADLRSAIARGMPGSAMPAFGWMEADELDLLVDHVRDLAVEGAVVRRIERYEFIGAPVDEAAIRTEVVRRQTPTEVVAVPPAVASTPAVLTRGKELYLQDCAACHGADGAGRKPVRHWADADRLRFTRDFTFGVTKGEVTREALAHRIFAGMPGSAMPPTEYDDPDDRAALLAYVQSLLRPGAAERLVQRRRTIHAQRVAGALPDDAGDPRWETVRVVTAPLVWKFDAVLEAQVAFLHDGEQLAALVRWQDESRDDRAIGGSAAGDGVAVQFSGEPDPPVFAMGGPSHPVSIWHWQPFRAEDVVGFLDLEQPPHVDSRVHRPMAGVFERGDTAAAGEVEGPPSAERLRDQGQALAVTPRYRNGFWEVVLRGPMPETIAAGGAADARVAFAVWNGAIGDRRGEKSVTMWHELVIE